MDTIENAGDADREGEIIVRLCLKNALKSGELLEEQIDSLVFRVLAWKYYKGLIKE